MRLLRRERNRGSAILMATHDLFRAKEVADRVGVMRRGRMVGCWSREELQGRDIEQLYLGLIRDEDQQVAGMA